MKRKWLIIIPLLLNLIVFGNICTVDAANETTYYCVIDNKGGVALKTSPKGHVAAWITLASSDYDMVAKNISYSADTDKLTISGVTAKSLVVYCSNLYIGTNPCVIDSLISRDYTKLDMEDGTHLACKNLEGTSIQCDLNISVEGNEYRKNRKSITKMADIAIIGNAAYTYTGKDICPKVSVKIGEKELNEGIDYTIQYKNNKNAGESAEIIVIGKGDYTGEKKTTFKINPANISGATIAVAGCTYNNLPQTPSVTVTYNGLVVDKANYETTEYSNNIKAGNRAIVTITGKGNFTGQKSQAFEIKQADISTATVKITGGPYIYTGKAQTAGIEVWLGSGKLNSGDYSVTYSNNINAGTATVTVKADGTNCLENKSCNTTFTISKKTPSLKFQQSVSKTWYTANGTHVFEVASTDCTGTLKYSSSNSKLVAVDSKVGGLTVKYKEKFGKVVITATFTPLDKTNFSTATIQKTIYVVPNRVAIENGTSAKSGELKIVWANSKKLYNAESYRIYYCKEKDGKCGTMILYGSTIARKKTITGLGKGNYYVKVVPCCKIDGVKVEGSASVTKKYAVK